MMRDCKQGRFSLRLKFLQRQFLQDGGLPFTDILSEEIVAQAMTEVGTCWKDRIYPPLITQWVFLGHLNLVLARQIDAPFQTRHAATPSRSPRLAPVLTQLFESLSRIALIPRSTTAPSVKLQPPANTIAVAWLTSPMNLPDRGPLDQAWSRPRGPFQQQLADQF